MTFRGFLSYGDNTYFNFNLLIMQISHVYLNDHDKETLYMYIWQYFVLYQPLHSFAAGETITIACSITLRSGGNYHHSMFHNPTAAVNLFHVGKQYLTFCKAEAAVTHNLIGRKIISNVKHPDARNSLPIFRRHTLKSQTQQCVRVPQMNATSNDRCLLYAYIYVVGAPSHFPTEYRHEAAVVSRKHRMK